jgi:hypothetical protein
VSSADEFGFSIAPDTLVSEVLHPRRYIPSER